MTFSDILKNEKGFLMRKKNCKTDINNYRQISLLSYISKIIEKIVHDRLYMYLENNNTFYKWHVGFNVTMAYKPVAFLLILKKHLTQSTKTFYQED